MQYVGWGTVIFCSVTDPEIFKGAECNVINPVALKFIAVAHNELYAFYTGKDGLLKSC